MEVEAPVLGLGCAPAGAPFDQHVVEAVEFPVQEFPGFLIGWPGRRGFHRVVELLIDGYPARAERDVDGLSHARLPSELGRSLGNHLVNGCFDGFCRRCGASQKAVCCSCGR